MRYVCPFKRRAPVEGEDADLRLVHGWTLHSTRADYKRIRDMMGREKDKRQCATQRN
jgi:hypothetical protein